MLLLRLQIRLDHRNSIAYTGYKISFSCTVKAIVSPNLKQCPSLGYQGIYFVQSRLSIVATPRHQTISEVDKF